VPGIDALGPDEGEGEGEGAGAGGAGEGGGAGGLAAAASAQAGDPSLANARIVFEGVSFAYPSRPHEPVLRRVSFVVEPGTCLALVGPSGAGKSSIVALLERYYDPTEGRITINGVDLRALRVPWLRRHLALVSQEPQLLPVSVRDNIAAFGGNPENVTLFGESAGGGCVTTLMTMPAAKGLFHRAIAQSSPVTSVYGPERPALIAGMFLELAGVNPDRAATDLRKVDAHELAAHTMDLLNKVATTMPGTVAFAPVVDGDVVHEDPLVAFQAGRAHRVPLIIGSNKDEASLFKLMQSPLMPISKDAVERMFELVSEDNPAVDVSLTDISSVYRGYPGQKACMGISRDAGFRMPSIWAATAHSAFAPTWMYRFDQAPPLMKLMGLGAMHATELPYVFGTLPTKVGKKDLVFRLGGLAAARRPMDRMHEHWLSFARTGDPEANAGRPWPQYRLKTRSTLIIDVTDTVVNDPDADVRRAWGDVPFGYN
jgi:para-nitrobenzyl esterase